MNARRLTYGLAAAFGVVSLWLLLRIWHTDDVSQLSAAAFLVGLSFWVLSPYAILVVAARIGKFRTVTWGALAVLVVIGYIGNFDYADANFHFASKSDPQNALVFLVLPFVQNVVAVVSMGLLLAIGYWLDGRKR